MATLYQKPKKAAEKTPMKPTEVKQTPKRANVDHDQIATRAYYLWEQNGRPMGQEIKLWLAAEAELRKQYTR